MISASVRSTCALASSSVSLPFSTSRATCPSVTLRALLQSRVDELLVDVLEHDGDVRGGDDLRDLTAHHARADDRGFEHEHGPAP